MDGLDSELAINRDLLKTGKGYLDVCKGLLDSIKAVNVGDVRFASNLLGNSKVIMGESSANKGREFLKRDHGIDLDQVHPSVDRFSISAININEEHPKTDQFSKAEEEKVTESVGEIKPRFEENPYLSKYQILEDLDPPKKFNAESVFQ